jgi:hypothetical protein
MTTLDASIDAVRPIADVESARRDGDGLASRFGQAIMKRLRAAAWTVLDPHTEFEPLD